MSWPYLSIRPRCSLALDHNGVTQNYDVLSLDQSGIVIENAKNIAGEFTFTLMFNDFDKKFTLKGTFSNLKGHFKVRPSDRREYINNVWQIIKNFDHLQTIELLKSQSIPHGFEVWALLSGLNDSPGGQWSDGEEWPFVSLKGQNIWSVGRPIQSHSRKIVMVGMSDAMRTLRASVPIAIHSKGMINIVGSIGSGRETFVRVIHEESGHDQQLHFVRSFSELEETIKMVPLSPQLYYIKDPDVSELEKISEISHLIAAQGSRLIIISESEINHPLLKNKIFVPSLHQRRSDLPQLIDHFIKHYSRLFHIREPHIMPEAMDHLISHHYQGEIKELKSICNQIIGHAGHHGIITLNDVLIFVKDESENTIFSELKKAA